LRVSDLMKLEKVRVLEYGSRRVIQVDTQKTGDLIDIPLHPQVITILERWQGWPKPMNPQDYNINLKKLGNPSLNHPQYDWKEVGKTTYLWCITEWSEVSDLVPEVNRQKLISELRSGELNDEAICIRIKNWHREWDSRCEIDADDDSKINGYSVRLIKD